jgi:hypothetical protein
MNILQHGIILVKPKRLLPPLSWIEHIPFAFFLIDLLKPNKFVELGVHKGVSFYAFCQAVDTLKLDTQCYGIDTWKGDEHAGFYGNEVFGEIYPYHQQNYARFAYLIRNTFQDALPYFSDGSIDLLHIDGLHSYEAVKKDFTEWLPKLSDKGVILLHDTQVREKGFGVWKLWEELRTQYPFYEFRYGYGLGVLVVGKAANQELLQFIEESKSNPFYHTLFYELGKAIRVENDLHNVEASLVQKEQREASYANKINELEASLGQKEQMLQEICRSRGWKLLQMYRVWKIRIRHLLHRKS